MKSSIEIRQATMEDVTQILKLWRELMDFHLPMDKFFEMNSEANMHFKSYIQECISSEEKIVLVALDSQINIIVGYLLACVAQYPPVYKFKLRGNMDSIVVNESYRKMHVGTRLVETAKNWFNTRGIGRIHAHIAAMNSISLSFWKKMGFKPIFEEMYYEA